MIASFGDRATEDLYHGRQTARARRFPHEVVDVALVKMDSLNAAASVLDLRAPPGGSNLPGRRELLRTLAAVCTGLKSLGGKTAGKYF